MENGLDFNKQRDPATVNFVQNGYWLDEKKMVWGVVDNGQHPSCEAMAHQAQDQNNHTKSMLDIICSFVE